MTLDSEFEPRPSLDLDRIIGAPEPDDVAADLPLFQPASPEPGSSSTKRANFLGRRAVAEDAPLITVPVRPRAPLGVRRATPEVPRARARTIKPAAPSEDMLSDSLLPTAEADRFAQESASNAAGETLASPWRRISAALVDMMLLSILDAVVLYLTLRLCGLTTAEMVRLPILPLVAFFLMLNGGYFIAFTTVGGQSIGKMALGIKVIAQEDGAVSIGRATLRTVAYLISALPLGAGFLPGVISPDRLALHDRLAHTRVIRPTQA
jgi:uncharacterized RDD family membrane protein YckC